MPNCCITGHRDIPEDKVDYIKQRLREEVQLAIADGYTYFLSGFADGADLLMAEVVVELRKTYPKLFLEAALPYANRSKAKDERFQELLKECNGVKIISEKYTPSCLMARNRYLVEHSQRVIAVYDGREKGGDRFYNASCSLHGTRCPGDRILNHLIYAKQGAARYGQLLVHSSYA